MMAMPIGPIGTVTAHGNRIGITDTIITIGHYFRIGLSGRNGRGCCSPYSGWKFA